MVLVVDEGAEDVGKLSVRAYFTHTMACVVVAVYLGKMSKSGLLGHMAFADQAKTLPRAGTVFSGQTVFSG